jgi:Protein of unknown function (DUF2442)
MTSSAIEYVARAADVSVSDDQLIVHLVDGRTISVPLTWYPRLLHATAMQRRNVRIIGDGEYLNWPEVDEDLTVSGLLRGNAAPESKAG